MIGHTNTPHRQEEVMRMMQLETIEDRTKVSNKRETRKKKRKKKFCREGER